MRDVSHGGGASGSNNGLDQASAMALAMAIRSLTTLTSLDIRCATLQVSEYGKKQEGRWGGRKECDRVKVSEGPDSVCNASESMRKWDEQFHGTQWAGQRLRKGKGRGRLTVYSQEILRGKYTTKYW